MVPQIRAQSAPLRILVIEDEILIRMALAEELRASGLTVIEANSAEEAWSYLKAGGHADLVFSDVHLPGSMNGLEFASRVGKYYPNLPVLLTSGTVLPAPEDKRGKFLPKPYAVDDAVGIVLATLGLKQGNGS